MPQIQSQKKRVKTNNKRTLAVASQKSALKTSIKKVLAAVDAKDKDAALNAYSTASSKLDKAVAKGIHHRNYASRQKSRLAKAINTIA
ncbi:MAG: 30S ribosomal protein S20 [Erysipelotrichaceae bacterium]|nr:30S ribosomal protein S20 [Erysipelotrichaceae bacterium]MCI9311827.1 30S ribosomal protein S20 [Erysipelotrichaceae bacterium]